MTALAASVLAVLEAEEGHRPLSAAQLARVLHVTGHAGGPLTVHQTEAALEELLTVGRVERVHSMRLGARYRAMTRPEGTAIP